VGHEERRYGKHSGICLETQCYPDQVNMPLLKGDCLYSPQRAYHQRTSFQLLTL
jgi:aldose 1-epimerase